MQNKNRIVKELQQFGLTQKEATAYMAALELGSTSIQHIAKQAGLNRSTVHIVCEGLKEKGFFGETRKGKKRLLFAENPEKIKKMIHEQKSLLEVKEKMLEELLPELRILDTTIGGRPKVRFYDGEQGFYDVCQRSIKRAKGEILFLSSVEDFYNTARSRYDDEYYIPERLKRNIPIRTVVFPGERTRKLKAKDKEEMRETRFISKKYQFKSAMFIYGDEFSMITSSQPWLGVVVESKELTQMMRQIFEQIWDASKED